MSIPNDVFENLPEDEAADLRSMIGEVFPVDEIDEWGNAWVTKWLHLSDGESNAHGLGLAPPEMEVVHVTENDA